MLGDQKLQELMEGVAVENLRKLVRELRLLLHGDGTVDVRCLPEAVGIDPRLNAPAGPCLVQRAIKPEAGLVLEDYDSTAGSCFFLISGSLSRTQVAWASTFARASRLRGRWTENPSWLRSRGTWWLW